jgi:hypothetical protein
VITLLPNKIPTFSFKVLYLSTNLMNTSKRESTLPTLEKVQMK